MLNTFVSSFKLKNTYRKNSILYMLKSIPLIKMILPQSLYANKDLTILANIISGFMEAGSAFIWKIVYFAVMFILPLEAMEKMNTGSLYTVLLFLTIIGGIFNTELFNPTKDKYYAIFLMRMDAREYTKASYSYFLIKQFIGLAVISILMAVLVKSWFVCIAVPLYVVCVKIIATTLMLRFNKTRNENKLSAVYIICAIIIFALPYVSVYFGYNINANVFYIILFLCVVSSVFCLKYIFGYKEYRMIYKNLYLKDSFIQMNNSAKSQVQQDVFLKKLEYSAEQSSNKSGYAYFNDLFMKRHRKLLTKSAKRIAVSFVIIFVGIIISCSIFPEIKVEFNKFTLNFLPYFLFVMYLINRGNAITQAMFMNCDHSMLSYRFYRQPKTILYLFAERLKTIIKINLLPASVIAVGLPFLLFITGGTDNPLNYIILFVTIIAMSVFFSVHCMVLYYLLQPYNAEIEMKNPLFSIFNFMTYVVCYIAIGKQVPTLIFGSLVSAFCIIYIVVSLLLAYRLAPKTFKLR